MKKTVSIFLALGSMAALALVLPSACTKAKAPVPLPEVTCNSTISFSTQIAPMIDANCASCHGVGAGTSPTLSNYAEISANAEAMIQAMRGTPELMPQGGPALPDSLIQQFQCWMEQGKLQN